MQNENNHKCCLHFHYSWAKCCLAMHECGSYIELATAMTILIKGAASECKGGDIKSLATVSKFPRYPSSLRARVVLITAWILWQLRFLEALHIYIDADSDKCQTTLSTTNTQSAMQVSKKVLTIYPLVIWWRKFCKLSSRYVQTGKS